MAAKKKTKKKTAGKQGNEPFDLIIAALKRNPNVAYATVKASAEKAGLTNQNWD